MSTHCIVKGAVGWLATSNATKEQYITYLNDDGSYGHHTIGTSGSWTQINQEYETYIKESDMVADVVNRNSGNVAGCYDIVAAKTGYYLRASSNGVVTQLIPELYNAGDTIPVANGNGNYNVNVLVLYLGIVVPN